MSASAITRIFVTSSYTRRIASSSVSGSGAGLAAEVAAREVMFALPVEQTEMLALMFDLRCTLEDVAYRLQVMHDAEYMSIVESYSRNNDLILELPPRKPTT